MQNILLNLSVETNDGYFGDWKSAIDESYALSKQLNIGCRLNYINQHIFLIYPTMSQLEINKLKETQIIIAL